MQPKFITFEGGEGAGKGTQIGLFCQTLDAMGIDYIQTREPGGCHEAETLRALLVKETGNNWTAYSELLLMSTARNEHLEKVIRPALAQGKWVVCDRFMDSSTVYQGVGRKLGIDTVQQVHNLVVKDTMPDLTFILDIDPVIGVSRSKKNVHADGQVNQETRFENLDLSFHQIVRQGYLDVYENNKDRCVIINADDTVDAVHQQIMQTLIAVCNS